MTGQGRQVVAVIAEDEAVLSADLRDRLARLWPELRIAAIAPNGLDALAAFERHRPDVMFLDIQMPELNGLEVARKIAGGCHVVFITAYDAHALAAFEQGAADYILKPLDDARLGVALKRLRERITAPPVDLEMMLRDLVAAGRPKSYLTWIKASRGTGIDLITVSDVTFFRAEAKYTSVFTLNAEALIRTSIKELCEELDPSCFWRIHRSTIVNVAAINQVVRGLGGSLSIKVRGRPEKLPVSEAYRHQFKQM